MEACASHATHLEVPVTTSAIRFICHLNLRHHLLPCCCIYCIHHSRHHLPRSTCCIMQRVVGHVVVVEVEIRQRDEVAANFFCRPFHFRTNETFNVEFWAMIGSSAEWVDEENETDSIVERRQHSLHLLQLKSALCISADFSSYISRISCVRF